MNRKSILVIDDDEICRRTIAAVLTQAEFNVLQADNGEDGAAMAFRHLPDLVMSDLVMPKLDGIGVFERLKSDPRTQSIPFMYVTGLVEREHVRPGASLGADAMLIKPFLLTDLLATVNDCLSKSHDRIHG